ncbi:prephenate dehydrogenase [Clostridium thermarum]|uniref:prephenate dehydrogenase n=1 Tax=Clostridium thermarum TaxID=1716543 RepID=UPI0013D2D7EB|nr:prephenate dehydrogenase [Clostridium thermarum]
MDISDFKITVVGLGLIGGSLAMALRDLKPNRLWAIDKDEQTIRAAENSGIIDKFKGDINSPLEDSDLIIIALYPEDTVKFILNNMQSFKRGSLITDTCGLKSGIIQKLSNFLRKDLEFIGGHPMAGKESSGFSSADKAIFYNANYILTPTENTNRDALKHLEAMILALGCKKPILLSPEEHDRLIAYTSHLPHLAAVSLINCFSTEKDLAGLVGGSYRDATRVADINSNLWLELLKLNKKNVTTALDSFIESLSQMRNSIANDDDAKLMNYFEQARRRRKGIG